MVFRLAEQVAGSPIFSYAFLLVAFAAIYMLVLRPQRNAQKQQAARLASLEIGDSVKTSSGFFGTVIDIDDENGAVIVEFGNNKNCRIPMLKEAIVEVEKPEDAVKPVEAVTEEKKKGLFGR